MDEIDWHKVADLREIEIDSLRAEIKRLRWELERSKDDCETMVHQRDEAVKLRGKTEAECEELRADVVFCARRRVSYVEVGHERTLFWSECDGPISSRVGRDMCDGTPADIRRAVREARNGVS